MVPKSGHIYIYLHIESVLFRDSTKIICILNLLICKGQDPTCLRYPLPQPVTISKVTPILFYCCFICRNVPFNYITSPPRSVQSDNEIYHTVLHCVKFHLAWTCPLSPAPDRLNE